jgi:hypothetical protein
MVFSIKLVNLFPNFDEACQKDHPVAWIAVNRGIHVVYHLSGIPPLTAG